MERRAASVRFISFLVALLFIAGSSRAQVTYPPRIGEREFISDRAGLITPEDQARIRATATKLLDEQGIPLVVVTIPSLADYGATGWPIERYAMNLFSEWGLGRSARNSGVLILVSKGDRKVRIELGAGWSHERDAVASTVVNDTIVPQFKAGEFSKGIAGGVDALAARLGTLPGASMGAAGIGRPAGSSPVPAPSPPVRKGFSFGPLVCIGAGLVLVLLVSMLRRLGRGAGGMTGPMGGAGMGGVGPGGYGPSGWGGGGWGGGLTGLLGGFMLGRLFGNRGSGSSSSSSGGGGIFGGGAGSAGSGGGGGGGGGGGFSGGGSFGGGFSGGGGATGSW